MADVELIGLDEDGEHVLLRSSDGTRFRLRIDEPLRAAVRRNRPQLEQLRASAHGMLAPREIQARIRAGNTAQEVADSGGSTLDQVRRYEGPVLAERAHIVAQGQRTKVGRESDAPNLGDLVTDRLASRGVATDDLDWDAFREAGHPWTVRVDYVVDSDAKTAMWAFDLAGRTLSALDDESRWLSETEIYDEPVPRRHLSPVRSRVFDIDTDPLKPSSLDAPEPAQDATSQILHQLSAKRGVRQEIPGEADDEEFEGFGPAQFSTHDDDASGAQGPVDDESQGAPTHPGGKLYSLANGRGRESASNDAQAGGAEDGSARTEGAGEAVSRSPKSAPSKATPSTSVRPHLDAPEGAEGPEADAPPPLERVKGRKGRPKVPSWDEIVFGAKPE